VKVPSSFGGLVEEDENEEELVGDNGEEPTATVAK
jgi:hypothetical protein